MLIEEHWPSLSLFGAADTYRLGFSRYTAYSQGVS